jgi:hypothetical protein
MEPSPRKTWAIGLGKKKLMFTGLATLLVAAGLLAFNGVPIPTGQNTSPATERPASEPQTSLPTAVPTDLAGRFAYYTEAAKAGNADAQLQLAMIYAKGDGVPRDYAQAATWFRAAADHGVVRAAYDLGVLYERGWGVPADPEAAASWYKKAADNEYPLAEYNLAVAYTKGVGVPKDLVEATLWYRRAAVQGVVQAMVNLAKLYEGGEVVSASSVDAYAWYLAAGGRGSQPGARRAEELFAALTPTEKLRAETVATDVAASIHDPPTPERPTQPAPTTGPAPELKQGIGPPTVTPRPGSAFWQ